jgi:hypothetical protein
MAYDGNSSGVNASTNFSSTAESFFTFSGCLEGSNSSYAASSESTQQIPFPAGTMSKLWCRVTTAASSSSTVVLRKNSGNGNETFSIGANQTGAFSDNSDTDTINSGDLLDVGITPGSTALEVTIIAATFTASTSTSTVLASVNLLTSGNLDSNTHFNCPVGVTMFNASESANTSEANSKNRQRKAMTASNLFIQIIQAGGGNPVTFRSRKNAANGNMVISASSSQTGLLQDTTSGHTDSLAVGDDFDISYQYSEGSGTTAQVLQGAWLTSSNGDSIYSCANDQGTSFNTSVTAYAGLCGGLEVTQSTETNAQVTVNSAFTFSQLLANVISNSISSASTLTLRANGGVAGVCCRFDRSKQHRCICRRHRYLYSCNNRCHEL